MTIGNLINHLTLQSIESIGNNVFNRFSRSEIMFLVILFDLFMQMINILYIKTNRVAQCCKTRSIK